MNLKKTLVGGFAAHALQAKEIQTAIQDLEKLGLPLPSRPARRFDPMATTMVDLQAATVLNRNQAATLDRVAVEAKDEPRLRVTRRHVGLLAAGVVLGLALIATYRSFSPPRAQGARPASAHVLRPRPVAAQHAQQAADGEPRQANAATTPQPQPAVAASPPQSAPVSVTPSDAARAFALGDDARALEHYRVLARTYPDQPAYPVLVEVLSTRTREPAP